MTQDDFMSTLERYSEELTNMLGRFRETRVMIEAWRREYNVERPYSSQGDATPAEFAQPWLAAATRITSNQTADSGSNAY
jgi:transposase InsO family protein